MICSMAKPSHRCCQAAGIDRVFKVEIGGRSLSGDHPRNRGFPALSRAEEGGNGMNPEGFVDSFKNPCPCRYFIIENLNVK